MPKQPELSPMQGLDETLFGEDTSQVQEEAVETTSASTPTPEPEISKIKVGEEEFSSEELSELVRIGKLGREVETKQNIKLENVYPEFTRKSQKLKEYEAKINQFESQNTATSPQGSSSIPASEEQAIQEAKEAARKLGILTKEDLADLGFVSKQDFRSFYDQERAAEKLLENASKFEKEIDGTDGRPPFKTRDVLEFMDNNGVTNLETAYKLMHEKELDAWKESELSKSKRPGLTTQEKTTPAKAPAQVKATKDNLGALIEEELFGGKQ